MSWNFSYEAPTRSTRLRIAFDARPTRDTLRYVADSRVIECPFFIIIFKSRHASWVCWRMKKEERRRIRIRVLFFWIFLLTFTADQLLKTSIWKIGSNLHLYEGERNGERRTKRDISKERERNEEGYFIFPTRERNEEGYFVFPTRERGTNREREEDGIFPEREGKEYIWSETDVAFLPYFLILINYHTSSKLFSFTIYPLD